MKTKQNKTNSAKKRPSLNPVRGGPRRRCPNWSKLGRLERCTEDYAHSGRCSFEKNYCPNGNPNCRKKGQHEVCTDGLRMSWRSEIVATVNRKGEKFWKLVVKMNEERKTKSNAA